MVKNTHPHSQRLQKPLDKRSGCGLPLAIGLMIIMGVLAGIALLLIFSPQILEQVSRVVVPIFASPTPTILIPSDVTPISPPTLSTTPAITPSPTPFRVNNLEIGQSFQERPITVTCLGSGSTVIVIASGLHGDESNPRYLLNELRDQIAQHPEWIPAEERICFIPTLNPDGAYINSRFNIRGVDLNRNWDTSDWVSNIVRGEGEVLVGGGGSAPLSEPENQAFANYLEQLRAGGSEVVVVFYHSTVTPTGYVRAGYVLVDGKIVWDEASSKLAEKYATTIQLPFTKEAVTQYPITGESLNWMAENGIAAFGIEMPDQGYYDSVIYQKHLNAILELMQNCEEFSQ
jgi:predicted deacylase